MSSELEDGSGTVRWRLLGGPLEPLEPEESGALVEGVKRALL